MKYNKNWTFMLINPSKFFPRPISGTYITLDKSSFVGILKININIKKLKNKISTNEFPIKWMKNQTKKSRKKSSIN